jgi:hypothetical protein
VIATTLLLLVTLQPKPSTQRLLVTIEVTRDVVVEPYRKDREEADIRELLQFFNAETAVVVRRGQRFQVSRSRGSMEGGCWIRFQRLEYDIASCWWLDGFTDHHADIFVVVEKK